MGISFSNIGTVGREQLITSGSNGEPNWSFLRMKKKFHGCLDICALKFLRMMKQKNCLRQIM